METADSSQTPGVAQFHAHWHALLPLVPTAAAAAVLHASSHAVTPATSVGLAAAPLVPAVWLLWGTLAAAFIGRWLTTTYQVVDGALIRSSGIINRQRLSIPVSEIASVHTSQTLIERILRYGDVTVETAGDTDQRLTDIPHPGRFVDKLEAIRAWVRVTEPDPAQPSLFDDDRPKGSRPRSLVEAVGTRRETWDTIARLGQLVDDGLLDRRRFDDAVIELLGA